MRRLIFAALVVTSLVPIHASTISNNDSCDIGTYPAATLLLPYFEVDLSDARKQTTIFSVTNTSAVPQIASVTIWTDWAFPVITFPLFLTGYDVQPINLYDVIARGLFAPPNGTSVSAPNARDPIGQPTNPLGTEPLPNLQNPKFLSTVATDCAAGRLPGQLALPYITDMRGLLASGRSAGSILSCPINGAEAQVGGNHGGSVAVGYVTIDVVSTCAPELPIDARYWDHILFDNVLTGDYQQIASDPVSGNYAGGNPMVHIRAVNAALPFTFYDRYTKLDRRQPLPSTIAARWISGTSAAFETHYKIWRESETGIDASCSSYANNGRLALGEIVRFDERENAWVAISPVVIDPPPPPVTTPAAFRIPVTDYLFPFVSISNDGAGWMYFNLLNGNARGVSQNWVVTTMFAEGRFGVESDATSLGNGCSPPSALLIGGGQVGPANDSVIPSVSEGSAAKEGRPPDRRIPRSRSE